MKKRRIRGLYGITPDLDDTAALHAKTNQILRGGAKLIQYRNKKANKVLRKRQAESLLQLCREFAIPMIVNDHPDLAMQIDADGVHIGEYDADIVAVRKQLGTEKIIGSSCYNKLELALQAEAKGADYVAFGAFYSTSTKQNTVVAPVEILNQAKKILSIPIVGIGGINQTNALPLIQNGVDAIAVSNSLYQAVDICKTAETFSQFFE